MNIMTTAHLFDRLDLFVRAWMVILVSVSKSFWFVIIHGIVEASIGWMIWTIPLAIWTPPEPDSLIWLVFAISILLVEVSALTVLVIWP